MADKQDSVTLGGGILYVGGKSDKPEKNDSIERRPDAPPCIGTIDGEPCPYKPIHKCKACGGTICLEHTCDFTANNPGERWHRYDGHYCPDCIDAVYAQYNAEVEESNTELKKQRQKEQTCNCLSSLGEGTCSCINDSINESCS